MSRGRLAQLVERLVYTENVGGSSPSLPTTSLCKARIMQVETFLRAAISLCVVAFGLLLAGTAAQASPMSFKVVTIGDPATCGKKCVRAVQAEGQIYLDTAEEFAKFLVSEPDANALKGVVLIQSPGGVVEGAYKLGYLFRELGLTIVVAQASDLKRDGQAGRMVSAQCYSACVFAMMGGKRRIIPPQSKVGVHAIFSNKFELDPLHIDPPFRKVKAGEPVNQVARNYAKYMGISPELINLSESIEPSSFLILSQAQIAKYHLGVTGAR